MTNYPLDPKTVFIIYFQIAVCCERLVYDRSARWFEICNIAELLTKNMFTHSSRIQCQFTIWVINTVMLFNCFVLFKGDSHPNPCRVNGTVHFRPKQFQYGFSHMSLFLNCFIHFHWRKGGCGLDKSTAEASEDPPYAQSTLQTTLALIVYLFTRLAQLI